VNVASGTIRMPLAHRSGSVLCAISTTRSGSAPACSSTALDAVNTSHGPTKSSSSAPSNATIPIVWAIPFPLRHRFLDHEVVRGGALVPERVKSVRLRGRGVPAL
jgi:hypothetical protein